MSKKKKSVQLNLLPQFLPGTPLAEESIHLFQDIIRIDTTNPPGNETKLAEFLENWVKKQKCPFVTTKIIESEPTRGSLIVDFKGTETNSCPSWGFMSHLDVVPAEGTWSHPPFSGELIEDKHDKFIWGRGTQDIKNMAVAHLVAMFALIREGFRPKGNIKVIIAADEEQGGLKGVGYLIKNHFEDMKVDFLINEGGGIKLPIKNDFIIQTGEKGIMWTKIKTHGRSGHGSAPGNFNDFAISKMMKVVQKIMAYNPKVELGKEFYDLANNISLPGIVKWVLCRKSIIRPLSKFVSKIAGQDLSQVVLPFIQDMITPTNLHSGIKENSISPNAEAILDIRSLPDHDRDLIHKEIKQAVGKKFAKELEIIPLQTQMATTSPLDTPLYKKIKEIMNDIWPNANLVPMLSAGSTDCKYFREKGIISYGFSPMLKDEDLTWLQLGGLSHGVNERHSVKNLMLQTDFAYRLMKTV